MILKIRRSYIVRTTCKKDICEKTARLFVRYKVYRKSWKDIKSTLKQEFFQEVDNAQRVSKKKEKKRRDIQRILLQNASQVNIETRDNTIYNRRYS
jgi:hypothetical protein